MTVQHLGVIVHGARAAQDHLVSDSLLLAWIKYIKPHCEPWDGVNCEQNDYEPLFPINWTELFLSEVHHICLE